MIVSAPSLPWPTSIVLLRIRLLSALSRSTNPPASCVAAIVLPTIVLWLPHANQSKKNSGGGGGVVVVQPNREQVVVGVPCGAEPAIQLLAIVCPPEAQCGEPSGSVVPSSPVRIVTILPSAWVTTPLMKFPVMVSLCAGLLYIP